MKLTLILLNAAKVYEDILPTSKTQIFRQTKKVSKPKTKTHCEQQPVKETLSTATTNCISNTKESNKEYRENEMQIQMLSRTLYQQIFKDYSHQPIDADSISRFKQNLQNHGIKPGETPKLPDINLKLPKLLGKNIEEHFFNIADEQCKSYRDLTNSLLFQTIPEQPKEWCFVEGWTYYSANGPITVSYPADDALIFDIEVCMTAGSAPTLACALGKTGWYSWTSPTLIICDNSSAAQQRKYSPSDLIPLETSGATEAKIIVGHNVSYDRARIKEQYEIKSTATRFLDTMSLHVCVSGITSYQRAMLKSKKELPEDDLLWSTQSALNSLAEVYKLYCDGATLDKERRNAFVEDSLPQIRDDFQNLMSYCAGDVCATQKVLRTLFPMFLQRFSHPATLAGMLEIGMAYLPVNTNWKRYINESNLSYEDLNIEAKYLLEKRANEACRLQHGEAYKNNLWMWDQDWSQQLLKFKKKKSKDENCDSEDVMEVDSREATLLQKAEQIELSCLKEKFSNLLKTRDLLPKRRPLLPGYPAWYRNLCEKSTQNGWAPGPSNIGTGMQVTPKLLSLCWEGYPLHYIKGQGWGFLVPHRTQLDDEDVDCKIPLQELVQKCPVIDTNIHASAKESEEAFTQLTKLVEANISKKDYYRKKKEDKTNGHYQGTGVWCNTELDNCCWFLKLPHKDGVSHRVGNPLARDFLNKFSENVLSGDGVAAERVIQIARMLSYWRNNRDRIMKQMVVWSGDTGAIIPQVVVCGTLTRRAMEPTWMTASNAQTERIGSELRGMVQAPQGYKIVGADVDSQELWIASVLGDANATRCHGATPFGWMTLNGTKSDGSDMHSVTARAVGISRDHAKVINYARIYGAGQTFAERLLKQFNPTISEGEAKSKAMKMFSLTKGRKYYYLLPEFQSEFLEKGYTRYEAMKLGAATGRTLGEMFHRPKWTGGTESAMFNRLEEIAEMEQPVTPFLQCRLSRALEPHSDNEDRFLPTRVNWVVQSGAVDFLHLMLVCMRWLMADNIRFSLSFHDEVRYMVPDALAYKAALALHATNLLTRSFCATRIGLTDLPQSIAFFTSVEVDTVLRKEAKSDCVTPSNPHGLSGGYGIANGEAVDITKAIELAGGNDLSAWPWHQKTNNTSVTAVVPKKGSNLKKEVNKKKSKIVL